MDQFDPTNQVSKKLVHLLRWTTFSGQTGRDFGWMDHNRYMLGHHNVATGCIKGISFDENLCDSVQKNQIGCNNKLTV